MSAAAKAAFGGKWKQVKTENLDDVMKEMAIGFLIRKMMGKANPEMDIEFNGDEVTVSMKIAMKTQTMKLKIGETVSVETSDGTAQAYTYEEGDELITVQTPDDTSKKQLTMRRKIVNGQLVMDMEVRERNAAKGSPALVAGKRIFDKM